jgi:hypothetical protein
MSEGCKQHIICQSIGLVEHVLFLQVFHLFIQFSWHIQLYFVMKIGAVPWHSAPLYHM